MYRSMKDALADVAMVMACIFPAAPDACVGVGDHHLETVTSLPGMVRFLGSLLDSHKMGLRSDIGAVALSLTTPCSTIHRGLADQVLN
jgi:hypothetical protein